MVWLDQLGKNTRGSRPRCVLLMDGDRAEVADRLTRLVIGLPNEVVITDNDLWMPCGKTSVSEARLGQLVKLLSPKYGVQRSQDVKRQLSAWWNPKGGNTPNWDIASSCRIRGTTGLLLVEAKAHGCELNSRGKKRFQGVHPTTSERITCEYARQLLRQPETFSQSPEDTGKYRETNITRFPTDSPGPGSWPPWRFPSFCFIWAFWMLRIWGMTDRCFDPSGNGSAF